MRFALALALTLVSTAAIAQQRPNPMFTGPVAHWITDPEAKPDSYGVYHFRHAFDLPSKPASFKVLVSADNRYRLFVNGEQVSSGPQKSDLMHWRYETVDLAPKLRAGRNVVAALVWNWGPTRPVAVFSLRTGFLLQGSSPAEAAVSTGSSWKVMRDAGYEFAPVTGRAAGGYYAASPGESVDGRQVPWGWEKDGFDDSGWAPARQMIATLPRGTDTYGAGENWQLVPRSIPPLEETPIRFAAVRHMEGTRTDDAFLRGPGDVVIPPHTKTTVLLDQSALTTAYAVLETSGGAGSSVALTYAEALVDKNGRKGNRNEVEGRTIVGVRDVFRPDGGPHRRFQTLWFRTYRYVQADVETAAEPLRIHDLHGIFTAYPYQERARFSSDLPWLADVWKMDWRVARLCAHDTYFDTPYYEQLQYAGDTRIQALISLYMAGDDRLVRQAITQFDLSRIPEGITASRYPSNLPQYIPPFSLIWIAMVHDYWMNRDDPRFVRHLLPGVRSVVGWFERHLDDTGMLGPLEWWCFMDWAREWPAGVPPNAYDGHSATISLLFAYALQRAAEMEDALGQKADAAKDRALAKRLTAAVQSRTWDAKRRLLRDSAESQTFSIQTNTLAVLTDAIPQAQQRAVMEKVIADKSLTQCTYYFDFYVHEAVRKAGLADRYVELLQPWKGMLDLGFTTTPENPEPTRSDSHAWSAHPNYGMLATILGIRPASPGFHTVRIAPALGALTHAEGSVPHPKGDIQVKLIREGERGIHADITLPEGLEGTFEWQGRKTPLHPGRQEMRG